MLFSFNLSGKTATFRKPDTNQDQYITYTLPPAPAIYGIFGSILGLGGYSKQYFSKSEEPDYFNLLKDVFISIVPNNLKVQKDFIKFNDQYTSKEFQKGAVNRIINEQFLLDFDLDIFVFSDSNPYINTLADNIKNYKTIFSPYLGKNEHRASISFIKEYSSEEIIEKEFSSSTQNEFIEIFSIFKVSNKKNILIKKPLVPEKGDNWLNFKQSENKEHYEFFENYPHSFISSTTQYKQSLFAYFKNKLVPVSSLDFSNSKIFFLKSENKHIYLFNGGD